MYIAVNTFFFTGAAPVGKKVYQLIYIMQGQKNPVRQRRRKQKIGVFVRLPESACTYIRQRSKKLEISQAQFIVNSVGLAGPDMPRKFKFIFNSHEA
jgi:hypothetical protein